MSTIDANCPHNFASFTFKFDYSQVFCTFAGGLCFHLNRLLLADAMLSECVKNIFHLSFDFL